MKVFTTLLSPRQPPKDIQIAVAWPGKRHQLNVKTTTSIAEVKAMIDNLEKIPPSDQILSYKDKPMKDKKNLAYYGVQNDRTIILSLKPGSEAFKASAAQVPKKSVQPAIEPTESQADPPHSESSSQASASPHPKPVSSSEPSNGNPAPAPQIISVSDEIHHHPGHVSEVSENFAMKEKATDLVKFVVQYGKKEFKLKMSQNTDVWAIKLELERSGIGLRAGEMVLTGEDEEPLDDEGTLDDFGIQNGAHLTVTAESE